MTEQALPGGDPKVPLVSLDARQTSEIPVTHSTEPRSTKRCATCHETKPVSEFYANTKGMPGHRPHCKPCHKAKRRERYRLYEGKDVPYEQVLKRDYGITLAIYNEMLRTQAHRCAICRRPETVRMKRSGELRRLQVDHDHVTGRVRELLCTRCNKVVWALEENYPLLGAINAYIEKWRETFAQG